MLEALRNAWRIEDLRRKLLYTMGLLVVFRIGSFVPVPGVNAGAMAAQLGIDEGNIFGFLNLFSGGALGRFTVFAMGVSPYITASIIIQLLTVVVPRLEQLAKEGGEGRKMIQQYTRYGTVGLGIMQAIGVTSLARSWGVLLDTSIFTFATIVITLTAGTTFLMWLGEKISEHGIGNGISLLIFAGIVAGVPVGTFNIFSALGEGGINPFSLIIFLLIGLGVIAGIIMVQQGERRIPVQYAKRVVGRRMYGGQSTHIPMKVNQAGVIPVIFASSVLMFPLTIAQFVPSISDFVERVMGIGTFGYNFFYFVFVIFFTYFYTAVTWNPVEVADNMRKHGGFIPGLRPGRPTAQYLDKTLSRLTMAGALFLGVIAVLPYIMAAVTRMPTSFLFLGGTGLLIVIGVALDTMKQIEAQLLMRHYEGFLK